MKIKLDLPLDQYTDGVVKIITMPQDREDYKKMLAVCDREDLENALKIMKDNRVYYNKQRDIRQEISIRDLPETENYPVEWKKWFCEKWNNMRKAAGKI